jgi:hypothetical protein
LIIEKLEERMLRLNSCCKSSLDDFDFSSIGFSSHQLKGSFLIAGARNLGFLCDEISEAAREKDVDKLRNQISILNRLVPQFKAELNSLLQDFKLRMEEKSSFF